MSGLESSRSALYVVDQRRFESTYHWLQKMLRRFSVPTTIILASGATGMARRRGPTIAMKLAFNRWTSPEPLARSDHRCRDACLAGARAGTAAGDRLSRSSPAPARHVLLSLRHDRSPVRDPDGAPSLRLYNFELMQKAPGVRVPTACWARTPRARRALAAMTCTFYNPPTFSPRRLSAGSSRKNSLPPPAASIAESDRICTMAPTCTTGPLSARNEQAAGR